MDAGGVRGVDGGRQSGWIADVEGSFLGSRLDVVNGRKLRKTATVEEKRQAAGLSQRDAAAYTHRNNVLWRAASAASTLSTGRRQDDGE